MDLKEHPKLFAKTGYLLKTFSLSFTMFSVIPLIVFFSLYIQYGEQDKVYLPKEQLELIIFVFGTVTLALLWGMKRILTKLTILSNNIPKILANEVDKKVLFELAQEEGEVAELACAFSEMMQALEKNYVDLEDAKKNLHDVLAKVGKALASMENFDLLIHLILETIVEALAAERAAIFIPSDKGGFEVKVSYGIEDAFLKDALFSLQPLLERMEKESQDMYLPEDFQQEATDVKGDLFIPPLYCTPLVYRDNFWGVMCLSGKRLKGDFTEDEKRIISNLSFQIAVAFQNAALNKDIERSYFDTIAALAVAVDARDSYSRGHSERVGTYAIKIGMLMGLEDPDIKILEEAARLHDIGKIGIADNILKKPGKFTEEEREIMRKHPIIGEGIVKPLKNFSSLREPIRHHHEFLDGTGYPDGLKGDEISLAARILTVSDIFDALTSERTYREALTIEEAMAELNNMVDRGKLDKKIVAALRKLIDEKTL